MTIAQQQAQVHYIWQQSFQSELDTALRDTLRQGVLLGVKSTLEAALVEELIEELNQELGFAAYERLPGGGKPPEQQRSGYSSTRHPVWPHQGPACTEVASGQQSPPMDALGTLSTRRAASA